MKSLTDKVREKLAFDEKAAEVEGKRQITYPSDFILGAEWEHARTAAIDEALVKCVEAMREHFEAKGACDHEGSCHDMREALAALEAAVEGK